MIGLDTHAFLIEGPEPLPIGEDISVTLRQPAPPPHPHPHLPPHPPPPHAPPHPHPLPPHAPPDASPHPHPFTPHWPHPTSTVVRHVALRNGDQTRVLIVPVTNAGASLPTRAPTTLDFVVNRARYRAQDPAATYTATATIVVP